MSVPVPGLMIMRASLRFALVAACVIGLLVGVTRITTGPQQRRSTDFIEGSHLEVSVIGDSLLTDMVRVHRAPLDAFRVLFASQQNAVTARSVLADQRPQSLFEHLEGLNPLRITNFSRPGAHVLVRDLANDPVAWQRWVLNIPSLPQQVTLALDRVQETDLYLFWTSHMEPLNWNDLKKLRSEGRLPLATATSDADLRTWLADQFALIFGGELERLISVIKTKRVAKAKTAIVVFGLFNWDETNALTREIEAAKAEGAQGFENARDRADSEGSLLLWRLLNQRLRQMVTSRLDAPSDRRSTQSVGGQIDGSLWLSFSDILETQDFSLLDVESDGIHPTPEGQSKISRSLFEGLKPALKYLEINSVNSNK